MHKIFNYLKRGTQWVSSLFLPELCFSCDEFSTTFLCHNCSKQISFKLEIKHSKTKERFYSFISYQNKIIKDLLHSLKFDSNKRVAEYIQDSLRTPFQELVQKADYCLPVPIHKKRLKKRGFNQVDLIFKELIEMENNKYLDIIERQKETISLFELTREERKTELEGAFRIKENAPDLLDKTVLIVDDIFTTGATSKEIASLLQKKGVKKVEVLSLAYA